MGDWYMDRLMRRSAVAAALFMLTGGAAMASTTLGVRGSRFALSGEPVFLLGMSYYAALGAGDSFVRQDLDDMQRLGFNWIRVWATWAAFGRDVSAVDAEGRPREPFLTKLRGLVAECDRRGMVVDVTLSRGDGINGAPRLQTLEAHLRAVRTLVNALRPFRNWYLDLANERNIKDKRYASLSDLKALRDEVKRLDPERLVTASHAGDIDREALRRYLHLVRLDFIAPHRPRNPKSPRQTAHKTEEYLSWCKALEHPAPVHYQEPFRRGFRPQRWEPSSGAFLTDLREAVEAGAAGWCLHNGDQKDRAEGKPRRSFDMRERRLFDQLDEEERRVAEAAAAIVRAAR